MVQISLQNSGGKVVFLWGFHRASPWAPTGVKVPWSLKVLDKVISNSNYEVGYIPAIMAVSRATAF